MTPEDTKEFRESVATRANQIVKVLHAHDLKVDDITVYAMLVLLVLTVRNTGASLGLFLKGIITEWEKADRMEAEHILQHVTEIISKTALEHFEPAQSH